MDKSDYAGIAFTEYKDANGFKRNITARADTLAQANSILDKELENIMAVGGVPYERTSFGGGRSFTPKPVREESAGCRECGAPVGEEEKITWKNKDYWVRNCTSGERHKTGFFRPAS